MGQIGGKNAAKRDRWANLFFISSISLLALNDFLYHIFAIKTPIPSLLSLELAVLVVSIKIIWMMHKLTKVEHIQFWILNSIEYRLNDVANQLRDLDQTISRKDKLDKDL